MAATTTTNTKPRKSLASQIDRLDIILDGLAEALEQSIANAVEQAVTVAVQKVMEGIVHEMLSNPQVQAKLQAKVADAIPEAKRKGKVTGWFSSRLEALRRFTGGKAKSAGQKISTVWQRARQFCVKAWNGICSIWTFKMQLAAAIGIGVAAGAVTYLYGSTLAALATGIGSFASAFAVQTSIWLKRMLTVRTNSMPVDVTSH